MPRYDLLAIDLDGTLFDSTRKVSQENRHALSQVTHAGTRVAVVTGRRLPAALPSLEGLDIDPLLVFNSGALIKESFQGPILRRRFLPLETAEEVITLGRCIGAEPIVHDGPDGEGHIVIETSPNTKPSMAYYLEKATPPALRVADLTAYLGRDPVQIGFVATVEEIRNIASSIESALGDKLKVARSEYPERDFALLDVLAPEATKAEALRFLAERYAVPREKTMAIGDNWNDLEMLEEAGFAVLMSNAPAELLARGFATTGTNDEAGVAKAIQMYALQ
jgi:Cof subfamily protein (haloacid dehalogenase superfamily)